MKTIIDNICKDLYDFAQTLKLDATRSIKAILPRYSDNTTSAPVVRQQSYVSHPERPWVVAGSTALVVGVVGAISSGGTWSYLLGGAGLASILYGQTKKKSQSDRSVSTPTMSANEPKGYEVAEKVIEISKMVEDRWRDKVEECKRAVQRVIETSAASTDVKDSLMGKTYTTERVSIDFNEIVSDLDSKPASSYPMIISEFEASVTRSIDKVATEQITIYKIISQKL